MTKTENEGSSKGSKAPDDPQLKLFEDPLPRRPRSPDAVFERADAQDFTGYRENDLFEHKQVGIHANDLGEYLSMWANTKPDGGLIVVGIHAKTRELLGCRSAEEPKINALKSTQANFCPDARAEVKEVPFRRSNEDEDDFLLLFRVPFNGRKVVRHVNGKAYWRIGEDKREIPPEVIRELENDFGQATFEQESCGLPYPDGFDMELIATWADTVKAAKGWDSATSNEQVLVNLHLGRLTGQPPRFLPNMACAMLFALDPVSLIAGCKSHCLRFRGEHEGTGADYSPLKDDFFEGTVPQVIEQTAKWLDAQLRNFTRQDAGGKFHNRHEYPREAWYEVVVNACVHRSYGLRNSFVSVKMFNDHLTVESPGGFMPTVSPDNIYDTTPHPRNPHLYQAMWYLEFVRCNNEGAKRIRDYMAKADLPPPEFSERTKNYSFVRVTLKNDITNRKLWSDEDSMKVLGQSLFEQLSEEERQVVNYVIEYGKINTSDAQRLTQFSWPKSNRMLHRLVDRGILTHVKNVAPGKERDPNAHFILRKPNGTRPSRSSEEE
jgi:ATP-dependent DNA helicase RecG